MNAFPSLSGPHVALGNPSPRVCVHPVSCGPDRDLCRVRAALASAVEIPLRQDFPGGNRAAPPTGFVRMGWNGLELQVLAELDDEEIVTTATRDNQLIYLLGDSFEIFLKVPDRDAHVEFHVAPNGKTLQLLFPSHAEFERYRKVSEPEFLARFGWTRGGFSSRVWIDADSRHWTVFAIVDLRLLAIDSAHGQELEFNFGRYDRTSRGGGPVLSCSSALSRLDFHSVAEWGRLLLTTETGVRA